MSHLPRLYNDLAWIWPLVSPPEDYAPEAAAIHAAIEQILGRADASAPRRTLLELGTGGGHTLSHLKAHYDCTAVDLSESMLALARQLNPQVEHHRGDMRTWGIDRCFDVVLVHDAIDYMITAADVTAVLANAHRHLRPGGVVVFAPTHVTETFEDHEVAHDHHTAPDGTAVTYAVYAHDPDTRDTSIETVMVYFIRRRDGSLRVEQDRDCCGLYSISKWTTMLIETGFQPHVQPLGNDIIGSHGTPLFLGLKHR